MFWDQVCNCWMRDSSIFWNVKNQYVCWWSWMSHCSRKQAVDKRLKYICDMNEEALLSFVGAMWEEHHGQDSLINWDRFSSLQYFQVSYCLNSKLWRKFSHVWDMKSKLLFQSLVKCMNGCLIASICERLIKDFRFTRSGLPDLFLWNPETKVRMTLKKYMHIKLPPPAQLKWFCFCPVIGSSNSRSEGSWW